MNLPVALGSTGAGGLFQGVLPWLIALLVVVLVGAVVLWHVRRSFRGGPWTAEHSFTLHDLRQMHRAGDLTDEEFERARSAIIDRARSSTSENMDAEGTGDRRKTDR